MAKLATILLAEIWLAENRKKGNVRMLKKRNFQSLVLMLIKSKAGSGDEIGVKRM